MPSLVTSDGRTLGWRERGGGPLLLCHPGGPGCSSEYFGELPVLAAQRTLLLLDPRGTGASDRPADPAAYDLEQYAADVEAVREHLGLERIDVLGHSHGGFVAMTWAGTNPEHVGRLVLANTTPRFTDAIRQARRERALSHQGQPYYEDAMAAMRAHHEGRYADDGVPRTLKEDRCRRRFRRMRCCTRDEGAGPGGLVALRGRPAGGDRKPPRGAPVKSRGAERRGDGVLSARQVWITKASESEPPMKCRKRIGDIRNRGRVVAPGGAWRGPADWPGGCPAWMVARA